MNKIVRNFWLDVALYLLLGLNIALVNLTPQTSVGMHPGLGWHIHAVLGTAMTVGCLVHIVWHWQWIYAALTGKAKGKFKLGMIGGVTVMMLLASFSGHEAMTSVTAGSFHSFTGAVALIGLFIHSVKHMHWMARMSKKLITQRGQNHVIQSA